MKRLKWWLATSGMLAVTSAVLTVAGAGASTASGLPTLTLALNGKTVVVGGSMTSGAVNVRTTVTGEAQGGPGLVHLNPGVPPSIFPRVSRLINQHHGDINYLNPYGSLIFAGSAKKGTSTEQTVLPAGNYIALDTNTNGSPPHAAFTVTQSAAPAPLPKPRATEKAIDNDFTGPKTLHKGEVVRFVNAGFLVHMNVWLKVKNMADAKKVVKLLLANAGPRAGAKLITGQGTFAGPMSSGGIVQTTITAKPGIYVQACFMNFQDGKVHTALGMERIIKIVK